MPVIGESLFMRRLVIGLTIALFALLPLIKALPTFLGTIIFLLSLPFLKEKFSREVKIAAIISILFFLWLFIVDLIPEAGQITLENLPSMSQFLIIPIAFLGLSRFSPKINLENISKFAFVIMTITCILGVLEWALVRERLIWAPFGNEGAKRYWFIGFGGYPRVALLIGNPLTFAEVSTPLLFAIFVNFWQQSRLERVLKLILLCLGAFVFVVLTQNRSGILLFLTQGFLLLLYLIASAPNEYRPKLINLSLLLIFVFLVMAFALAQLTDSIIEARMLAAWQGIQDFYKTKDANSVTELSSKLRLDYYQSALSAILKKPISGYGVSDMMQALLPFLQTEEARNIHYHLTPHSLILNNLLSGGLIGLLLLLSLLLSPVKLALALRRENHKQGIDWLYLSLVLFTVIFVAGLTNNVFYDDHKNTAFLSYLFCLIIGMSQERSHRDN